MNGSQNYECRCGYHHHMEKMAEGVRANQVAVRHALVMGHDVDAAERGQGADKSNPAEHAPTGHAQKGVNHHDQNAEETQSNFRRKTMQVRNLLGWEVHYCSSRLSEMVARDASRSRGDAITVCVSEGDVGAGRTTSCGAPPS